MEHDQRDGPREIILTTGHHDNWLHVNKDNPPGKRVAFECIGVKDTFTGPALLKVLAVRPSVLLEACRYSILPFPLSDDRNSWCLQSSVPITVYSLQCSLMYLSFVTRGSDRFLVRLYAAQCGNSVSSDKRPCDSVERTCDLSSIIGKTWNELCNASQLDFTKQLARAMVINWIRLSCP